MNYCGAPDAGGRQLQAMLGTLPSRTMYDRSRTVLSPLHMLHNALGCLPRPTVGGIQRQGVGVRHSEYLKFLEPPGNRGHIAVLTPGTAFRRILALAELLGIACQPHRKELSVSLLCQALNPAEQCFVPGCSRVEHVRQHEAVVRGAELADGGEDRPPDGFDMCPCALREGKGGSAIIPDNAKHGKIDQLVIDHLGPRQPPDFFGDRVFPDGRDADEVDDGIVEFHTGPRVLIALDRLEDDVPFAHVPDAQAQRRALFARPVQRVVRPCGSRMITPCPSMVSPFVGS